MPFRKTSRTPRRSVSAARRRRNCSLTAGPWCWESFCHSFGCVARTKSRTSRDSCDVFPHVDLAGHRGGDEGGAQLLEAVDDFTDLRNQCIDPRRFSVEILCNCLLIAEGG